MVYQLEICEKPSGNHMKSQKHSIKCFYTWQKMMVTPYVTWFISMHYFVAVPYGACENAFQCIKAGELWFTWEAFAPCHIMISSVGKTRTGCCKWELTVLFIGGLACVRSSSFQAKHIQGVQLPAPFAPGANQFSILTSYLFSICGWTYLCIEQWSLTSVEPCELL